MKREKIACSCHNVSYGKIIDAVHAGADRRSERQPVPGPAAASAEHFCPPSCRT